MITERHRNFFGACAPTIINGGCITQLFFHELFASLVPVFSSLCQLGGPPFLSHTSCHCHYAFVPLGWNHALQSKRLKLVGRHCLRQRWKLALSYLPGGLQCSKCSSLPRSLYMIFARACFPSLENLATTEVSRGFDPHHGIKRRCSSSVALNMFLLGCKMPGCGVQGTGYRTHPLEVLEMVRSESWCGRCIWLMP